VSEVLDVAIATLIILMALVALVLMLAFLHMLLERWPPLVQHRLSAVRTAEAALREFLTEDEYRQLSTTGYLEVASPTQPERVYRVPRGYGRVLVLEGGRAIEKVCIQPLAMNLPEADVVLMHKLLIQADEEFYLRTANHFRDPVRPLSGWPWTSSDQVQFD
jgi:hypothetical protein